MSQGKNDLVPVCVGPSKLHRYCRGSTVQLFGSKILHENCKASKIYLSGVGEAPVRLTGIVI